MESRLRAGEGEEGEASRERRRVVGKIVTLLCLAGLKPRRNFLEKKGGEGRRYVGGYNEMSSILADLWRPGI